MKLFSILSRPSDFRKRLEEARPRLYRVAYSWCHNPALADDLVQEALAKALKNARQLREPELTERWLFRILANCWRDHFRQSRDMDDVDEVVLSHDLTPEQEHDRAETVQRVRRAIAALPEGQRQALTLVDLEGFSYAEVAEILGLPIGTVMSRICRARRTLRDLLFEPGPEARVTEISRFRRIK
jgi:RNA polymerase sigma-70 factor, ECF subfamily